MVNCCQVVVVLFGTSGIIEQPVLFFQGLKIVGSVYLVCLGYRQWTAHKPQLDIQKKTNFKSTRRAIVDGFVVCGTNPKAVIYYAALLPQFVLPHYDKDTRLVTLAITNIVIARLVLTFYTMLAHSARYWFNREEYWKTQNRLAGMLMISAGVALFMVSR